jgi:transposase-like protein
VFEHTSEHASQRAAITSIVSKIGCSAQTLTSWIKPRETYSGQRPGVTSEELAREKAPERENRRANSILRKAAA